MRAVAGEFENRRLQSVSSWRSGLAGEGQQMADTGFTRPAPEAAHGRPSPSVESQLTGPTSYSRSRPEADGGDGQLLGIRPFGIATIGTGHLELRFR